ncbi:MAG: hypothetical protein ACR2JU_08295 [Nocardioidaceae bacterium]
MRRWLPRALTAAAVWGLALAYALISDRAVYPAALAAAVVATLAVCWLWADTSFLSQPPRWQLYRSSTAWRTYDPRFVRLAQEVAETADQREAAAAVHDHLVKVADRLLLDTYDVDRAADPAAARRVLGEPLASYLDDGPGRDRDVMSPRVSAALDRLESL